MTSLEYIKEINKSTIDNEKINHITEKYSDQLPDIVKKIVSYSDSGIFLDDEIRILSYEEILNAEKDLHVPFKDLCILPLADCEDNDFIVFDYKNSLWAKFNIVDKTIFKKRQTLEELLP